MRQSSGPPVRPTARDSLLLARVAAFGSAVIAAFSLLLGTWPEAEVKGGLHYALPFLLAAAVGLLLAGLWHTTLAYAAHTEQAHERILAACFGAALCVIGIGCSGWFLASLIGGSAALQEYQHLYLTQLRNAGNVVVANDSAEANMPRDLDSEASKLDALAEGEARGEYSGVWGKGAIYKTIKNDAARLADKGEHLGQLQAARESNLRRFRAYLAEAEKASAANDATSFEDFVAKATAELVTAGTTHLDVVDLGLGLDVAHARPEIMGVIQRIAGVKAEIDKASQDVDIPAYQPIDAKRAILLAPQPLAWFTAVVVELLPLLFVGLLLTVWRRPQVAPVNLPDDHPNQPHDDRLIGMEAYRSNPALNPAE